MFNEASLLNKQHRQWSDAIALIIRACQHNEVTLLNMQLPLDCKKVVVALSCMEHTDTNQRGADCTGMLE